MADAVFNVDVKLEVLKLEILRTFEELLRVILTRV